MLTTLTGVLFGRHRFNLKVPPCPQISLRISGVGRHRLVVHVPDRQVVQVRRGRLAVRADRHAGRRRVRRIFHGGRNIRNRVLPEGLLRLVLELRRFRHRGCKSSPKVFFPPLTGGWLSVIIIFNREHARRSVFRKRLTF